MSYSDVLKKGLEDKEDTVQIVPQRIILYPRLNRCNHDICQEIYNYRKIGNYRLNGGVGTAVIKFENDKSIKILLGKERYGKFANQYNICAGKMDKRDRRCCLQTACRELSEEFKINLTINEFLRKGDGRKIICRGTPVFILDYTHEDIDIDYLNEAIKISIIDDDPGHLREMSHIKWFNIFNKSDNLSILTIKVINKLMEVS